MALVKLVTGLVIMAMLNCSHQPVETTIPVKAKTVEVAVDLTFNERKTVTLGGSSYELEFIDVVEERCADCTRCYKPNGIYADAYVLINGTKTKLRLYSCTVQEVVNWESIVKNFNVVKINNSLDAGVAKLSPGDLVNIPKSSYSLTILFRL